MNSKLIARAPVLAAVFAAAVAMSGCQYLHKQHKTDLSYVERPAA